MPELHIIPQWSGWPSLDPAHILGKSQRSDMWKRCAIWALRPGMRGGSKLLQILSSTRRFWSQARLADQTMRFGDYTKVYWVGGNLVWSYMPQLAIFHPKLLCARLPLNCNPRSIRITHMTILPMLESVLYKKSELHWGEKPDIIEYLIRYTNALSRLFSKQQQREPFISNLLTIRLLLVFNLAGFDHA